MEGSSPMPYRSALFSAVRNQRIKQIKLLTAGPSVVTGSQSYERDRIPLPLLRKQVSVCTLELLNEGETVNSADDKKKSHVVLIFAFNDTVMKAYAPGSTFIHFRSKANLDLFQLNAFACSPPKSTVDLQESGIHLSVWEPSKEEWNNLRLRGLVF